MPPTRYDCGMLDHDTRLLHLASSTHLVPLCGALLSDVTVGPLRAFPDCEECDECFEYAEP